MLVNGLVVYRYQLAAFIAPYFTAFSHATTKETKHDGRKAFHIATFCVMLVKEWCQSISLRVFCGEMEKKRRNDDVLDSVVIDDNRTTRKIDVRRNVVYGKRTSTSSIIIDAIFGYIDMKHVTEC